MHMSSPYLDRPEHPGADVLVAPAAWRRHSFVATLASRATFAAMQLAVLGPMEVVSGAQRLALGGPKQRLVLGILAAARRRTVTLDELVDGLWPEGPQAQPRKTVQVYITRLRRTFGDDADAIRSDAAGYRLDTSALPTDADLFEADLDAVTRELDDDAAVALLRTALGRWRGDAFVDLRD
jgi:DNA-binding SARP family transcriptional activator